MSSRGIARRGDSTAATERVEMKAAPLRGAGKSDLVCSSSDPMAVAIRHAKATKARLTTLSDCVPEIVTFEVGGERFSVQRQLIAKDPQSLLFVLANEHYVTVRESAAGRHAKRPAKRARVQTDESALDAAQSVITIPDKDPAVFGRIINVVRGYKSSVLDDRWREACEQDIAFYGLQKSWHEVFPAPEELSFTVKSWGSFITTSFLSGVASAYHTHGQHVATFVVVVQGAEKAAVGVDAFEEENSSEKALHIVNGETHNRALYWNDGNVTTCFPVAKSFSSGSTYKSSAVVRVTLDADEGTVRWSLHDVDCVAMMRLPKNKGGYAFCAVSHKGAQVNIADMHSASAA